ncbi:flavin reductase [Pseudemcibacter aquimaris]|uniref:flavin reductase n=1 Tax=Pseudemcibacter aquimaris TaxID=2857064 RepID=UPI002012CABA|nr:flavin reductase [Pseudemcibacter aquimaris]MCC3861260.1 flavin reductase [Pseudemcibacter aquimaris]WDU58034.1 flavin reductase [Pseudemcibacter aquimaris]
MTKIDPRELRNCFGKFATGITVITAVGPDGKKIGLTVNSFSSLSIDPPMILWSLDNRSNNLDALKEASHFAVNVLASDQMDLSNNFASPKEDKFEGIETLEGKCAIPLLKDTVAHLECKNVNQYPGGDHTIFIGEVEHFEMGDKKPLLYANGNYGLAARHPSNQFPEPEAKSHDGDFVMLMLLKSYREIAAPFHRELMDEGIPVAHARLISSISRNPGIITAELASDTDVDMATVSMSLKMLSDNGHINMDDDKGYYLTETGEEYMLSIRSRVKRFEDEVLDGFSSDEIDMLKKTLQKLINRSDI